MGADTVVIRGAAMGIEPLGGRRQRPLRGSPALLASGGVSPKLASLKQGRALIRLTLRCSAVPQRPPKGSTPIAVGRAVVVPPLRSPVSGVAPSPSGGGLGWGRAAFDTFAACASAACPHPNLPPGGEGARPQRSAERQFTPGARYAARCGRPLCAAEERSVSRIRARSCLSEASSARPREARAAQGSPKGRHSGAVRAVPHAGRLSQRNKKC